MVLQDEQTGFWCHTLLMGVPKKLRFNLKGKIRHHAIHIFRSNPTFHFWEVSRVNKHCPIGIFQRGVTH